MKVAPILGTLIALTGVAAADTAMPGPCSVAYARAPQEARDVIDAWVKQEPACATTLTLRVVPTTGGWYLLATLPDGRTHERVAPDLQTAGALVASWVADDGPPVAAASTGGADVTIDVPPDATVTVTPTSTVIAGPEAPVIAPPPLTQAFHVPDEILRDGGEPERAHAGATRWVSAAGMYLAAAGGGAGGRVDVDLASSRHWTFGVGVAVTQLLANLYTAEQATQGTYKIQTVRGVATLGYQMEHDHWQLHLGIAAGLHYAENYAVDSSMPAAAVLPFADTKVTGELSTIITRRIGKTWGVMAGAMLVAAPRSVPSWADAATARALSGNAVAEMQFSAGIRHAL